MPAPILSASCAADASLVRFTGWLDQHGASLSEKLEIGGCHGKRGIYARDSLEVGEMVAYVPLRLLVTRANATSHPLFQSPQATPLRGPDLQALFLLAQRYQGGMWQPYVQALPQSIGTTLAWSDSELREMQASDLVKHDSIRRSAISRSHASASTVQPSLVEHSDDWSWALTMVWSRTHSIPIPGAGTIAAMPPLIDMFIRGGPASMAR